MSKEYLLKTMQNVNIDSYTWTLYFLKMDGRKPNPYFVYKHTFKNTSYLPDYISSLCDVVVKYQIESLDSIQVYNGENSKTSCDKLSIDNELIKVQWEKLHKSVAGAPREYIQGKYQGYILDGRPKSDTLPGIVMMKTGNPIISLDKKNSKVFKHSAANELDDITDELCRLYLLVDFMVIGNTLYTFNQNFEKVFKIEQTLHRIKNNAIEQIIAVGAFKDAEEVQKLMNAYTSPKTFLTLREERVGKLADNEKRIEVAKLLTLQMEDEQIVISTQEEANKLIKYLCYKIFQDKETDKLIEVNSVVKENV